MKFTKPIKELRSDECCTLGHTSDYTTGWCAIVAMTLTFACIDLSNPAPARLRLHISYPRYGAEGSRPSPDNQGRVNASEPAPLANPYREARSQSGITGRLAEAHYFSVAKEGEISKRAWESLRIKVIPATEAEQRAGGRALKLTGVQVAAHESRGPVFLDRIDEFQIDDFDDLALRLIRQRKRTHCRRMHRH